MNVLVTGSKGFIGKNLLIHLSLIPDVKIIEYDMDDNFSKIEDNINNIDFIFHLAGVNRPDNVDEFYKGNTDLTKSIIDLLNDKKKTIPFVYSSSTQAELDNDYGKSKRQAEEYISSNYNNGIIYRFHNVFGKWCRPNYNSVIATFCYNISHNLEISVNDPDKELELIYIDDICETLVKLLTDNDNKNKKVNYIEPRYKKTLGEIADLIKSFKGNMESIFVPKTGDAFIKKLFATYVSYVPIEEMVTRTEMHVDARGSFTELVKTLDSGQFSVSVSAPGVFRGNHYHNTKMERFIVVKGKAKISFRKVDDSEKIDFVVSGDDIKVITIPVGYTHKIENIGDDDMILCLWCNELLDHNHMDTYPMYV